MAVACIFHQIDTIVIVGRRAERAGIGQRHRVHGDKDAVLHHTHLKQSGRIGGDGRGIEVHHQAAGVGKLAGGCSQRADTRTRRELKLIIHIAVAGIARPVVGAGEGGKTGGDTLVCHPACGLVTGGEPLKTGGIGNRLIRLSPCCQWQHQSC